jgi:hypothetical protein
VVVLDEHLRGPGGPASAAELLALVASLSPEARSIVVTGYAEAGKIRAAIAAGAWDYLEKGAPHFDVLFPVRVRHAVEAARERRLRVLPPAEVEAELRRSWVEARSPDVDRHRKGRLLEQTLDLLFRSIPGLGQTTLNARAAREEFDLVVQNLSTDPLLSKEGSFFLVECKNTKAPQEHRSVQEFRSKVRLRHGRIRLGILVSVSGFTSGAREAHAVTANEDEVVLLISGEDLTAWIDAPDRSAWLRDRLQRTILRRT